MEIRNRINILLFVLFLGLTACSTDEEPAPDCLPLGVSARSFLSDEDFTSLTVEVVYVTGYEPTQNSLSSVETFLETYLHKPAGISVQLRAIPSPGVGTYSIDEIRDVENKHRTLFTSGKNLTAFIFIADDKSTSSTSKELVLGKAYKNTSLVIFEKDIRELAQSAGISSSQIQQTTIKHEFGHLFGLVDNGSPAQSDHVYTDPENPNEKGHCSIAGCLMARDLDYTKQSNLTLENQCHLDLVANGGK